MAHVILTKAQMEALKQSFATLQPVDALLELWRAVEPAWDNLASVNPMEYQIPRKQATALLDSVPAQYKAAWMNLWLNSAPGTFDHEAERKVNYKVDSPQACIYHIHSEPCMCR